jgi:ferredoxin-NADP reductase
MASPRIIMNLTVTATRKEPGDVLVMELKHPRKPSLPPFEPGSHVDVHLADGKVRQYSLCGDPTDLGRYTIAVKCEQAGRGGSLRIHGTVSPGFTLPVSAPRNHFALGESRGPVLLLAGGIGITPILAMARAGAAGQIIRAALLHAQQGAHAPLVGHRERSRLRQCAAAFRR